MECAKLRDTAFVSRRDLSLAGRCEGEGNRNRDAGNAARRMPDELCLQNPLSAEVDGACSTRPVGAREPLHARRGCVCDFAASAATERRYISLHFFTSHRLSPCVSTVNNMNERARAQNFIASSPFEFTNRTLRDLRKKKERRCSVGWQVFGFCSFQRQWPCGLRARTRQSRRTRARLRRMQRKGIPTGHRRR